MSNIGTRIDRASKYSLMVVQMLSPCADPENFVRIDSTQLWQRFIVMRDRFSTYEVFTCGGFRKFCLRGPVPHWQRLFYLNRENGIRTSITREIYSFVIFQGEGGGGGPMSLPLDSRMISILDRCHVIQQVYISVVRLIFQHCVAVRTLMHREG